MNCPHCYSQVPSFIIKPFTNRETRCPECLRYYSSKEAIDETRKNAKTKREQDTAKVS